MTPRGRVSLKRPGPWLALLLSVLIATPQFNYLINSDFLPLDYAASRAKVGGIADSVNFVGAQLADHLFFILLILLGGLCWKGTKTDCPKSDSEQELPIKSFIWVVIVGPIVIVSLLPLLASVGLKPMWGTPMFNFSGFLLLYWFGNRLNLIRAKRIIMASLSLIPLIGALSITEHLYKADFSDKPSRTLWPQTDISKHLTEEFENSTDQHLNYVLGHYWEAGIVASSHYETIRVMVGGDPVKSPWISENELSKSGYLTVWQSGKTPAEPLATRITQLKERGLEEQTKMFNWNSQNKHPISLSYLIVPPAE